MMIGTTVSHYRILEHLGGGGMGVVYKAEDLKLERTVALKFLPPEWSRDPDARERFMREAKAASALDHPNICNIHEIDETDEGRLFIAMAYYEGDTLKKRIERGPLPINEAIGLATQVAEGLQRAHEAGIVHRDIKPANVIITERGEAKIVDFGLAKLAGEFGLTRTGSTVGTPHYMSPEQARGDEVGPATDIWSLGVVLYEMVSGVRPFRGESGDAVVRSILDDAPLRLRDLRSDTPAMLERIVTRSLERDPEKRYASAEDLLTDLKALEAAESEETLGTTTMGAAPGKGRWLKVGAPIAAVLALAVAALLLWRAQKTPPPEPTEEGPKRIVVLPFKNLGPPEESYFAYGMTEAITSRLAAVSGLEIISRTTADRYQDTDKTAPQIGEELDVGYVLEGSVLWDKQGGGRGRVRITPQLISAAEDKHLWSDQYDRDIESIFELQSNIAEQIVTRLRVTLRGPEREALEALPTDNMDAYNAYLRGLEHRGRFDPAELDQAVAMFERAVELDPDFALAYVMLSLNHTVAYLFRIDATEERMARAKRAADRALEIDPDLPAGHGALGFYYDRCLGDSERAFEEYGIAARHRPNDADLIFGMALAHRRKGRWQEAVEGFERAAGLDPQNYDTLNELAYTYSRLRRLEEAAEVVERAIALAPDRVDAYLTRYTIHCSRYGHLPQSRRALEQAPDTIPGLEFTWIHQEMGERNYQAALKRIARYPQPVVQSDYSFRPKSLLECECYHEMKEPERAQLACAQAVVLLERVSKERPEDPRVYQALGMAFAYLDRKDEAIREGERAVSMVPVSENAEIGPLYVEVLRRWTGSSICSQSRTQSQLPLFVTTPGGTPSATTRGFRRSSRSTGRKNDRQDSLPLQDRREARRGRDGCGVSGQGHGARPRRGGEGAARGGGAGRGAAGPVRARGQAARIAQPLEHRFHLLVRKRRCPPYCHSERGRRPSRGIWAGGARRRNRDCSFPGPRVGRRRNPGGADQEGADPCRRRPAHRPPDRRGARGRPRAGHHPPRPQARQRDAVVRGQGQDPRLRSRQGVGTRGG
jgi:TolB-like protein/Flp pilus assembly protein TadD/predicted Ser/Thr protein kinase